MNWKSILLVLCYIWRTNEWNTVKYFSYIDLISGPVYMLIALLIAYSVKNRNQDSVSIYKYLVPGLLMKIGGGIFLCLIYSLYYGGGDTIQYFNSAATLSNLLYHDPSGYFSLIFKGNTAQSWSYFNHTTGWPTSYMYRDMKTFIVCEIT